MTWEGLPDSFNSRIILICKSQAYFSNACQSLKASLSTVHFILYLTPTIYLERPHFLHEVRVTQFPLQVSLPAWSEDNSFCYSHQCSTVQLGKHFQRLPIPFYPIIILFQTSNAAPQHVAIYDFWHNQVSQLRNPPTYPSFKYFSHTYYITDKKVYFMFFQLFLKGLQIFRQELRFHLLNAFFCDRQPVGQLLQLLLLKLHQHVM